MKVVVLVKTEKPFITEAVKEYDCSLEDFERLKELLRRVQLE